MATTSGHMTKLVELARERSSPKRRELLREISDLFLDEPGMQSGEAGGHVDAILTQVVQDVEESVRAELALRFADAAAAPAGLVRQLAMDAIDVARPLLERCAALDDDTLVDIARSTGAEHVRALAARPHMSEAVADAVVARGDGEAMVTLARNETAALSRRAMETLVDHAETNTALHAPLVERKELPADLLNEMFFTVETKLRERILERNEQFPPEELERAFAAARKRFAGKAGRTPRDFDDAMKFIQVKKLRKKLDGALLLDLVRDRETTKATLAFGELSELDFHTARRVLEQPAVDPLAIACRAAGIEADLFVTLAMLRPTTGERAEADAQVLTEIYSALPEETAVRAMRFWRVRRDADEAA